MHSGSHCGRIREGLVPAVPSFGGSLPASSGDRLDGLYGDTTLLAESQQLLEVGCIVGLAHHRKIVGQQHRVERELLETLDVAAGDAGAMAGDADEAHLTLLSGLEGGLEGSAWTHRGLTPLAVDEVVELDQVNEVDAEPLERLVDSLPSAFVRPLSGFGGEKEAISILQQARG